MSTGTSYRAPTISVFDPRVRRALADGADVPGRVQDGPTCGLYALGMVMDFWAQKSPGAKDPLVQSSDTLRTDSHSRPPNDARLLLDEARRRGYTTQGEMFYADQLAQLAKSFGYQARVTPHFTVADAEAAIDRKHPVLVAFDVDNAGNPGKSGGSRAHWAVLEGHFQANGEEYFVATHAWEGKEYVWRAKDLLASIEQMRTSDFPTAPKDISQCLRGKMIELVR